jgi:small-conductance mechanosensitive channel
MNATPMWGPQGDIRPVDSSFLSAVGYDRNSHVLYLRFTSTTALYAFAEVPEEVFEGLLAAASKGQYFNSRVRDRYRQERVS